MKLSEKIKKLEFLHELIESEHTGSPQQLAGRINVSRRTLFRCLLDIKDLGFRISYCSYRQTYYFIADKEEKENFEKK
jgi:predicted DNA-binding transcriptional regulator YafY